jgi:hypothetical protein
MVLKILTKIFQLTVKFHDSNATWYLLFNIACRTLVLKGLNITNLTWSGHYFNRTPVQGLLQQAIFIYFNSWELRADIRLKN